MAYLRSPPICTSATPGTVCSRGLTTRLTMSVSSSGLIVSLVKASQIVGVASASTLAMMGSSTASGSRPRTRATRSRTSAAAVSGFLVSLKRTVIWLRSVRDTEVMMSTPSMPAIESSSGLVTCDSMTSEEAPMSRVLTLTSGSSMRGYSRRLSWLNDTRPIRISSSDITLASTGRRIDVSEIFMTILQFRRPLRAEPADGGPEAAPEAGRPPARGPPAATAAPGLLRSIDAHRQAVAAQQARLARGGDDVAGLQALQDLDLAGQAQADARLQPLRHLACRRAPRRP